MTFVQRFERSEGVSHVVTWGRALEGQSGRGKALQGSMPEVCKGTVKRHLCRVDQRESSSKRSERQGRSGPVG